MRYNAAIIGLSRSGKTTKAKELFENFPDTGCSIFVNTQYEEYFTDYLSSFSHWNINMPKAVINPDGREALMPFIENLFKTQTQTKEKKPIRIIIDEIYLYQDLPDARQTLRKLIVDGLRWNIQTIITAHLPQMVDPYIYKNVHLYYFFNLNNAAYDYFKRVWHIDLFAYKQYLAIPYNYVLYDGNTFFRRQETQDGMKAVTGTEKPRAASVADGVDNKIGEAVTNEAKPTEIKTP